MDEEIEINQIVCAACGKPMSAMSCSYSPDNKKTKYFCSEECSTKEEEGEK